MTPLCEDQVGLHQLIATDFDKIIPSSTAEQQPANYKRITIITLPDKIIIIIIATI